MFAGDNGIPPRHVVGAGLVPARVACTQEAGDHKGRPYNTHCNCLSSPAYVAGEHLIPVVFGAVHARHEPARSAQKNHPLSLACRAAARQRERVQGEGAPRCASSVATSVCTYPLTPTPLPLSVADATAGARDSTYVNAGLTAQNPSVSISRRQHKPATKSHCR